MSPIVHKLYIGTMSAIVVLTFAYLSTKGYGYYKTPLVERFYHPDHAMFKSSGLLGQGLGVAGTLMMAVGVFGYMARKRYRILANFGRLKYWLEFHIFLCVLGPILVLFHTAFKFGGVVSVAFWSMVAVVASGVVGRFIYLQIPRSIEGRELSLHELNAIQGDLRQRLQHLQVFDEEKTAAIFQNTQSSDVEKDKKTGFLMKMYLDWQAGQAKKRILRGQLQTSGLDSTKINQALQLFQQEINLNFKIARLQKMQEIFRYWHVVHLPFALIMLVIVLVHIAITWALGYRWIF